MGTPLNEALVLSNEDIARLVSMSDAIDALERAFRDEAAGRAKTMERTRIVWDGRRMQALGGYVESGGSAAVKTWLVTERGAQPTLVLFSLEDGSVLGLMEAVELGRIRTGAASGLATRHLSAPDADVLLLVGTGRQAFAQAAGVAEVRSLRKILVAARDRERTASFAARLEEELGIQTEPAASIPKAAAEAAVVCTVTSAREPVLFGTHLAPGAHVNAAGAIAPGAREVDDDVFERADRVIVDSVEQAREESAELASAVAAGALRWEDVAPLHEAIVSGSERPTGAVTVFKSLGVGLEDAAIAQLAWERSHARAGG